MTELGLLLARYIFSFVSDENSMDVGISTASIFNKAMVEDIPAMLSPMGCQRIEVFLNTFSEYRPEFVRLLRSRIDDVGLEVYSVHPMSNQFEAQLFSIHPRQKADAFSVYRDALNAGRILGASHYVMHGSPHLGGTAKNLEFERIVPVFRELLDIAAEYGITLCLENVSWCFFHAPAFGAELRRRLGDGRLKFVLDIKQAVRSGEDPFAFVEAVGEDLENWHLCDYAFDGAEKLSLKMPGKGQCDFRALGTAMVEKGYRGPAFVEVYSDMYSGLDELKASYESVRSVLCDL